MLKLVKITSVKGGNASPTPPKLYLEPVEDVCLVRYNGERWLLPRAMAELLIAAYDAMKGDLYRPVPRRKVFGKMDDVRAATAIVTIHRLNKWLRGKKIPLRIETIRASELGGVDEPMVLFREAYCI